MQKAFVLLSGGLDSTTLLYHAMKEFDGNVEAVSVNYGQRHKKELDFAADTCKLLGISHTIMPLENLLGGQMLTDDTIPIPDATYDDLVGVSPTYVPFRNGLMLSMLSAFAQAWASEMLKAGDEEAQATLFFGAHADDARNWAYPDCTPEFIGAMASAIWIGTYQAVRLATPFMFMRKEAIVQAGAFLGVPFESTWSCYAGGEKHCGKCPTCYSRKHAFRDAGITDPTDYAVQGMYPGDEPAAEITHVSLQDKGDTPDTQVARQL